MKKASLASLIALFLSLPAAALAAVPQTLSFQARIGDNGRPVTGSHSVKFAFWDCDGSAPTTCVDPANVLWTETQTLTLSDGVLTAVLGADTTTPNPLPPAIFNGLPLFLEVTMDGTAFTPRMAVHSVPYAFRAAEADNATTAANLNCSGCVQDAEIASVSFAKVTGVPAFACSRSTTGCSLAGAVGSTVVACVSACPAGTNVTGGGCDGFTTTTINVSRPSGNGWDCWWTRSIGIGNANTLNSYSVCCQ